MRTFSIADETWEALHNPIQEDSPSGESLRYEGTYDTVIELRRQDRADLPQGVWEHSLKTADWAKIESVCTEALANKSKDLQIILWLAEAWYNRYGIKGFERGLTLLHNVTERFWETVHPQVRDGDVDFRTAPLVWLCETLTIQLRRMQLTNPTRGDMSACTLGDWESALKLERLRAKDPETFKKADESGKITLERFVESAGKTEGSFLAPRYDAVLAAIVRVDALDTYLDDKLGRDGPSFRALRNLLTTVKTVFEDTVFDAAGYKPGRTSPTEDVVIETQETLESDGDSGIQNTAGAHASISQSAGGEIVINSRAQAYELLEMAADYLQQVEPHSPTPYLVRRAVSWGDKSLVGVLEEFMHDPKQIEWLADVIGISTGE